MALQDSSENIVSTMRRQLIATQYVLQNFQKQSSTFLFVAHGGIFYFLFLYSYLKNEDLHSVQIEFNSNEAHIVEIHIV